MTQILLNFDPGTLSALRKGPEELAAEVKTAAVVQWYAERRISQSKAAEILGVSRSRFLEELFHRHVAAVQTDFGPLREALAGLER